MRRIPGMNLKTAEQIIIDICEVIDERQGDNGVILGVFASPSDGDKADGYMVQLPLGSEGIRAALACFLDEIAFARAASTFAPMVPLRAGFPETARVDAPVCAQCKNRGVPGGCL